MSFADQKETPESLLEDVIEDVTTLNRSYATALKADTNEIIANKHMKDEQHYCSTQSKHVQTFLIRTS